MKKILLTLTAVISFTAFTQAQLLPTNPLSGKKIKATVQEQLSTARFSHQFVAAQARIAANYYPDSMTLASWDSTTGQYNLQSIMQLQYANTADISRIDHSFDFGIGNELLARESMQWRSAGELKSYLYQEVEAGVLVDRLFFEMNYNAYGHVTSRIYYVDMGGQSRQTGHLSPFIGDSLAYTYNSQGVITGLTFYLMHPFFGNGGWSPVTRSSQIVYSASAEPVSMLSEAYDEQSQQFLSPQIITQMQWGFGFGSWSKVFGMTNPFADDLSVLPQTELSLIQPTEYLTQINTASGLENYNRQFSASSQGLITDLEAESWDGSSWQPESRSAYNYDQGKLSEIVYYTPIPSGWQPVERYTFDYNGQLLMETTHAYDHGGSWLIDEGTRYAYSFLNNKIESLETDIWSADSSRFLPNDKLSFFYHPGSTASVKNEHLIKLKIWPNPATNLVNLEIEEKYRGQNGQLTLINLQGQVVKTYALTAYETQSEIQLPLTELNTGLYLLQLQMGDNQQTIRLLKNN